MIGSKRYLQGALLIMLILLGIYILQAMQEAKLKKNNEPEVVKKEVVEKPIVYSPEEDVSFVFGKTYINAKKELLADGWRVFTPEDFVSKGDKKYPEIGECDGDMCKVSFRKGDIVVRINVQTKENENSIEWKVIESR